MSLVSLTHPLTHSLSLPLEVRFVCFLVGWRLCFSIDLINRHDGYIDCFGQGRFSARVVDRFDRILFLSLLVRLAVFYNYDRILSLVALFERRHDA